MGGAAAESQAELESIRSQFFCHNVSLDDLAHSVLRELVRSVTETSAELRQQKTLLALFEQKRENLVEQIRDLDRGSAGDGTTSDEGLSARLGSRRRIQLNRSLQRTLDQLGACTHRVVGLELRRNSLRNERRELGGKLRVVRTQAKDLELLTLDLLSKTFLAGNLPLPEALCARRAQLIGETRSLQVEQEQEESEAAVTLV